MINWCIGKQQFLSLHLASLKYIERRILSTHTIKTNWFARLLKTIPVLILLLSGSFTLAVPTVVLAEPSALLEITGDGVTSPVTFTLDQLQAMDQYQHVYSTINTWPTKRWYVAKGVKLRDLFNLAGIKTDAALINFTSSDGYTVTLTTKELLNDKRYYFPHLKENNDSDGSIPGFPADAKEVEPILALLSAENNNNFAAMNDIDALLLVCGQRAVTEQTNNIFLKYISKIEVLTTPPQKWDNPKANIGSGDVSAGTMIELNNKRNDADKIYYTTDGSIPTVNSPIFNWSARRWWNQRPDNLMSINKAIEIKEGTIIKAITIGPGRTDSDVVTFSYHIGDPNKADNQAKMPGGPPANVSLDQDMADVRIGGSLELEAIVGPDNTADKSVTWSSSDTRVATVDNQGLVTMVGPGVATITAKTIVGNLTATCTVKSTSEGIEDQITAAVELNGNDEQANLSGPQELKSKQPYPAEKEIAVSGSTSPEDKTEDSVEPQLSKETWKYLAKKELVTSSLANTGSSSPQPGSQPGQVFEISTGAAPLPLQVEQSNLDICIAIIFLFLFLSGAGKRYTEYIKEVAR
ncbi:MAG: FN3 associated domain-containing protein [Syntrophomonadaceae bacterium]|nr:FN3 associated domain-containing protein [Syntrophomonadaceae bacterium]